VIVIDASALAETLLGRRAALVAVGEARAAEAVGDMASVRLRR
jgi:hypothetical protein